MCQSAVCLHDSNDCGDMSLVGKSSHSPRNERLTKASSGGLIAVQVSPLAPYTRQTTFACQTDQPHASPSLSCTLTFYMPAAKSTLSASLFMLHHFNDLHDICSWRRMTRTWPCNSGSIQSAFWLVAPAAADHRYTHTSQPAFLGFASGIIVRFQDNSFEQQWPAHNKACTLLARGCESRLVSGPGSGAGDRIFISLSGSPGNSLRNALACVPILSGEVASNLVL